MPTTAPQTQPLGFCPLLHDIWRPRLFIDVEFGHGRNENQLPPHQSIYVKELREKLKYAHRKAQEYSEKQQARHIFLYDSRCKGAYLTEGDLVLVGVTAFKGKHKTQDKWEEDEYVVKSQAYAGIVVYEVEPVIARKKIVLHRNLLLP